MSLKDTDRKVYFTSRSGNEGGNKLNEVSKLLTPAEVARIVGRTTGTLRNWRTQRRNLPYVKVGTKAYYRPEDVSAYMERAVQIVEVD